MAHFKIIGTSHIASQSVRQIKRAFKTNKPDIVAVELDKERAKRIFEEPRAPRFKDVFEMGIMGYAFALIGGFLQRHLGAKVGLKPGDDMRTAIREANRYAVPLFLIDQPIQKTLLNVSKKMSFWEKCKLGFYSFGIVLVPFSRFFKSKKKIDLRKTPPSDLVEESIDKLKASFPGLYTALISDRNKYMTRQLKYLAARYSDKKILVVIGAGHKKEIEKALVMPAVAG